MQVWNVLHADRWKYRTQKWRKKSPYAHNNTILLGCFLATKALIDNRKKHVKQQYLLHMSSQYGERWSTNGWNLLASLGHPSKFQRVSRLAFVTAATSLNRGQPNFAQCLVVSWPGILYIIHFRGLLPPNGILHGAKFTLRPSPKSSVLLYWQRYCTTLK